MKRSGVSASLTHSTAAALWCTTVGGFGSALTKAIVAGPLGGLARPRLSERQAIMSSCLLPGRRQHLCFKLGSGWSRKVNDPAVTITRYRARTHDRLVRVIPTSI